MKSFRQQNTLFSLILALVVLLSGSQLRSHTPPALELLSESISNLASLNYFTAKEIEIPVPGTGQSIIAKWNFTGSGYLFQQLPCVPLEIKATSQATDNNTFALLSETLIKYATHKTKDELAFVTWLSDATLSPVKIFGIKLFLLTNYAYQHKNLDIFKTELFRLLFRLSLTQGVDIVDSSIPLSSYLPNVIKKHIQNVMPSSLAMIDSLWHALTSHDDINNAETIDKTHMIETFVFNDEALAQQCFEACKQTQQTTKNAGITSIIKEHISKLGYNVIPYDDFMRLNKSNNNKDSELGKINSDLKNIPDLSKALTHSAHKIFMSTDQALPTVLQEADKNNASLALIPDENRWWIVSMSQDLDIASTFTYVSKSLVGMCKQYAAMRKTYFEAHPLEMNALKKTYEINQQQQRRTELFLKTEEGIASQQRINKQLDLLKAHHEQSDVASIKSPEVKTLTQEIETLTSNINKLKNLVQPGSSDAYLDQHITKLTSQLKDKQKQLAALTYTASNISQLELSKLLEAVNEIKADGEAVPALLEQTIAQLKAEIKKQNATSSQAEVPLYEKLQIRKKIAAIYTEEAQQIDALKNKKRDAIENITDPSTQKVELITFKALQEPKFNAYSQHLKDKASKILEDNKKINELDAYQAIKMDDLDEKQKMQRMQLELEVGHLLHENARQSFIGTLLSGDGEIKELVLDLLTKPEYQTLRQQTMNVITHIIKRCKHLQNPENKILYEGLIKIFAPELLPLFQGLTITQ